MYTAYLHNLVTRQEPTIKKSPRSADLISYLSTTLGIIIPATRSSKLPPYLHVLTILGSVSTGTAYTIHNTYSTCIVRSASYTWHLTASICATDLLTYLPRELGGGSGNVAGLPRRGHPHHTTLHLAHLFSRTSSIQLPVPSNTRILANPISSELLSVEHGRNPPEARPGW